MRTDLQVHHQREERARLQRLVEQGTFGAALSAEERLTILSLWRTAHHHPANSRFSLDGGVRLITSGWAGWLRRSTDGRRLIFLFLLPGDFIVPGLAVHSCELVSLMPVRTVDAAALAADGGARAPRTSQLIQDSGLRYRRLLLDHLTRLLIGSTTGSLALLLTEFHDRALRSGACEDGRFSLPVGQRLLAAALGRSAVQINKVIKKFQADGLIRVGYDWIQVIDPVALRSLSGLQDFELAPSAADREAEPGAALSVPPLLLQQLMNS